MALWIMCDPQDRPKAEGHSHKHKVVWFPSNRFDSLLNTVTSSVVSPSSTPRQRARQLVEQRALILDRLLASHLHR